MINFLLANDCSLNCKYCYQKKLHDKKIMDLEYFKKQIEKIDKKEIIHLFGGEPFKNKKIMNYISNLNEEFYFKITTNVIETDFKIINKMIKNKNLKYLKFSLDCINANDRYSKQQEKIILNKINNFLKNLKNEYELKIEFHFVFNKIHYNKMFENYKFFSEFNFKFNKKIKISYGLNVDESKEEEDLNIIFKEYEKIIKFDIENYYNINFSNFLPKNYRFCDSKKHTTYNIDHFFNGCPVMIYEKKNENISLKCKNCKNEFCFSCILANEKDCNYFIKLKEFLKKRLNQ